MKTVVFYLPVLLFVVTTKADFKMNSEAIANEIVRFAAQFVEKLDHQKSAVSSPLSVEILLALIALGSTDETLEEIIGSLGIPESSIRSTFLSVSSKLKSVKGVTLDVANKVYVMEGPYDLHPDLKDDAIQIFDCEIEKLDFSQSQEACDRINSWVEGKTNNRIKDLISPDFLDAMTQLVLVNAIYFKGTWKTPFNPLNTFPRPFYGFDGEIEIPMMDMQDNFYYGESEALEAKLLELPYVGDEASMLIVLPYEKKGLKDVIGKLASGVNLISEIGNMSELKVQVTIPKFKIETTMDLTDLLPKMGIKKMFSETDSDLTKLLDGDEKVFVSKAIQKAFIEVNEEGAEAAAATEITIESRDMFGLDPFTADHPFLFGLRIGQTPQFFGTYHGC